MLVEGKDAPCPLPRYGMAGTIDALGIYRAGKASLDQTAFIHISVPRITSGIGR